MIADHVATPEGVDSDFTGGAFPGDAVASVPEGIGELHLANLGQDFEQGRSGAAGRVLFESVMHFHDFQIKERAENLGGLPGQPEEGINPGGVVRGPDNRDARGGLPDELFFRFGMTGGSDDQSPTVLGTEFGHRGGHLMKRELDNDVGLGNYLGQIVTLVNRSGYGQIGLVDRSGEEGLPHSSLGPVDDESRHVGTDLSVKRPGLKGKRSRLRAF